MTKIKYIFILILCLFAISLQAGQQQGAGEPQVVSDPCSDMGASGTYDHWWNGEYSGDTDKACQDSGASVVDATDVTAGVIDAGGAINGSYGALINANNEHVRWANNSETIDTAGTVQVTVTTPASFNHDQVLWEIYTDTSNQIIGYYHQATDRIYLRHEQSGSADYHYIAAPAESTTATLYWSWEVNGSSSRLCLKIGAGAWDCTTTTMTAFAGTVDSYAIGDDQNNYLTGDGGDTWKEDDFQIREGYEGT